ncbi:MAG: PTS sugar transporter subunit IIA [Enterococcus avium]
MIKSELACLNKKLSNKEEVIELVGDLLYKNGYVTKDYTQSMKERDKLVSTFMGNSLAIPHGTDEGREFILKSGIAFIQIPEGVVYTDNGDVVKLVFGIAGKNDEHLELLSKIAIACSEVENIERLITAKDLVKVNQILNENSE